FPAPDRWDAEDAVPFSSARKWSSVSFTGRGTWVLGAPEMVLRPDADAAVLRRAEWLAGQGHRVLLLARADGAEANPAADGAEARPAADRGPFLHPVEVVVEGDYLSIVNYLHALERLPWRIHWQRLELLAGDYPSNRVRIVIGALSLSRDWMSV
ncbi:MAG TPA: hypothetical protein VMT92_03420, partial [Steroidobacteraceae bacterium]|nr:hypothetical protein [Steroidobacteraceae bacterium]